MQQYQNVKYSTTSVVRPQYEIYCNIFQKRKSKRKKCNQHLLKDWTYNVTICAQSALLAAVYVCAVLRLSPFLLSFLDKPTCFYTHWSVRNFTIFATCSVHHFRSFTDTKLSRAQTMNVHALAKDEYTSRCSALLRPKKTRFVWKAYHLKPSTTKQCCHCNAAKLAISFHPY